MTKCVNSSKEYTKKKAKYKVICGFLKLKKKKSYFSFYLIKKVIIL